MINPLNYPVAFTNPRRLTFVSAWHEHIPFAFFIVDLLRPRTFVELGTHYGDSYCAFCQAVKELSLETKCYAVDTWQGDPHAGFYGSDVLEDLRAHHDPFYGNFSELIQSTFDDARQRFPDHSIDLLHIDGFHTYKAVKHDFFTWLPKVSSRGIVLLHDTNVTERGFGIKTFFNEIKGQYPHFEFFHGYGLGVVAVGEHIPEAIQKLFKMSPQEADNFRKYFAILGNRLTLQVEYQRLSNQLKTEKELCTKVICLAQQSTNELYEKLYTNSQPDGKFQWQIGWFKPQREELSIIMPVYKTSEITARALMAIGRCTTRPFEVIIIDNGNDPALRELLKSLPEDLQRRISLISNEENAGYPVACNQGLAAARGEYLVVMNNDVLVTPYWASRLMAAFNVDKTIGIVGPYTNFAAGIQGVQGCSYDEDSLEDWAHKWYQKNAGNLKPVNRLIGFLWMIKRKVVDDVGGLDPLYGIGNFEDDDYCLRAQLAGYKLVLAEDVFVHHYGSQSFRQHSRAYADILQTNAMLFAAKWGIQMHGNSYSPVDVVSRGPEGFDPGNLYIPLQFAAIFSPQVAPLDVGAGGRTGILCIPDPSDRECRWLEVVRQYAHNYRSDAEFALIIRVEPSRVEWLNQVVSAIQQMALKEKIDLEREDIVIEARQIPSSQRGSVYRAARYFIPLPGVRREAFLREARACGLEVIDPARVGEVVLSYR